MKLILLSCPTCGQSLTPENDDVVVQCQHCWSPAAIGVNGPGRIPVHFAVAEGVSVTTVKWVPFWVFEGRVHIKKRETQGGRRSDREDSEALWAEPRRLFAPAWNVNMRTIKELGSRLIQRQPEYRLIDKPDDARLTSATVTPGDALKLLEFIILAIEAQRKDWLRDLLFEIETGKPEFWAMPQGKYW